MDDLKPRVGNYYTAYFIPKPYLSLANVFLFVPADGIIL